MDTDLLPDIAILADDLTSAADAAGPFVSRHHRAWIGRGRSPKRIASVLAVDSGSRSVSAAQAAERVAALTPQLAARRILYKTVDSTLRGHVEQELEACFHASGRKTLVFGPAFPAAGRTTEGGIQLVDGVPVADTVYGRDPVHPAKHSCLSRLVPASITQVVLLDASTQEQLDAQVAALPVPESILWVGSPGMAVALARRFAPPSNTSTWTANAGDILIAVGSANECSHRQADAVAQLAGITVLRSPRERQTDPAAVLAQITEQAAQRLRSSCISAVIATGGDTMEAILDHLGVHEIEILQELDPGFPLGRVLLDDGRELLVAMKAGGFGSDDVLLRATNRLRAASTNSPNAFTSHTASP